MRPLRIAAAFLGLQAPLLLLPATARAALIADGDEFSVAFDPPGARVCTMFPVAARDPVGCAGLTLPATDLPPDTEKRNVATGTIRWDAAGGDAYSAVFSVTRVPMANAAEPDLAAAEEFARGMVEGAADSVHGKVRSGWPHTELRRYNGGQSIARISSYLDGLKGAQKATMEHQVAYVVWVKGAVYTFILMSGADHAAAVDALADDSARSIRFSHPAPPRQSADYRMGYMLGQFVGWGVMGILGLVTTLFVLRRGRQRGRVAAANPGGRLP
jgi:hypothetical protein